jgi:hypothetical protein
MSFAHECRQRDPAGRSDLDGADVGQKIATVSDPVFLAGEMAFRPRVSSDSQPHSSQTRSWERSVSSSSSTRRDMRARGPATRWPSESHQAVPHHEKTWREASPGFEVSRACRHVYRSALETGKRVTEVELGECGIPRAWRHSGVLRLLMKHAG